MIGAYAVTLVKYVVFICMHAGIISICVELFTMDRDSTMVDKSLFSGEELVVHYMVKLSLVLLLAVILSSAKVVGLAIKFGIESVDRLVLGVDIEVGSAALSVCEGYVNVRGLVVKNPDSRGWDTDCLMEIDTVIVKINMGLLACSRGKKFELTRLELRGVHVNFDKTLGADSNVQMVLDYVGGGKQPTSTESVPPKKEKEPEEPKKEKEPEAPKKEKEPDATSDASSGPEVAVHKVLISDIGAQAVVSGSAIRFSLGDIDFPDLQQHLDGGRGAVVGDVISILLSTILKTVLANAGPDAMYTRLAGCGRQTAKLARNLGMRAFGGCACVQ